MKKVMVFGTFDILHPGHINFFRQARTLGDYLIAVVARDSTVMRLKKKKPLFNEMQRLRHLRQVYLVNKVVLGNHVDSFAVIEKHKPDVIALGYDQRHFADHLVPELARRKLKIELVRLKAFKYHKYKSSIIRSSFDKARKK
ncbi:MAG: adenylyltransferase/cytidyltransferase family protein [Candidatus Woesearchaeota archaeon]